MMEAFFDSSELETTDFNFSCSHRSATSFPRVGTTITKKPLTRVSKPMSGAHGKRGLERGWQKRLAKGWRRVGEALAQGWHKVGEELAQG